MKNLMGEGWNHLKAWDGDIADRIKPIAGGMARASEAPEVVYRSQPYDEDHRLETNKPSTGILPFTLLPL
jgi:hypothetical protein